MHAIFHFVENNAITFLSKRLHHLNERRQKDDIGSWPPNQVKKFIPLVLIQHQNSYTKELQILKAKMYREKILFSTKSNSNFCRFNSYVEKNFNSSKATQDISEILATLEDGNDPNFILIEGDPGIGKSFLLKEIAHQWSKGKLLQRFKLVLLVYLRDPFIKQLSTIEQLLQSLCKRDSRAKKIASACSDYLFQNDGEDLVLLLDGYDEFPPELQQNSLIADILNREVLPNCSIIISSRPHASISLQQLADVKVDIWGFTEEDKKQYIRQVLKGQSEKIQELEQYLDSHLNINSLCQVPYNMAILAFLYVNGNCLPKNSTELYKKFIYVTVCGNLKKCGHSINSAIPDLTNLPEPANKIVKQLSKLSLESINSSKLTFTQDEIKEACPDIIAIPETTNGFGLLQAVEHYTLTGKTITFNFAHLSIQEFLAAHYIDCHLSPVDVLKTLEKTFWSIHHLNVFVFYVALTNGQHPSFKKFLSEGQSNNTISVKFLHDQLKCFRLFQCFYEAGDHELCHCIEEAETFNYKQGKSLELSTNKLLANELECITFFLTHSVYKEWAEGVNLYRCYIEDQGVRILHHGLVGAGITITKLWLDGCNGLTSSSLPLISDIVISCKVKVLWIDGNDIIGEDEKFYKMLSDSSSMLESLHMADAKLTSTATIQLFAALATGNKLRLLWVTNNAITDEATNTIAATLKENTSLTKLNIGDNPITSESAHYIIKALQFNSTLEELVLPEYPEKIKKALLSSVEEVNQIREICKCKVKLDVKFW